MMREEAPTRSNLRWTFLWGGGVPVCCEGKGLQENEPKGDKRRPVGARRRVGFCKRLKRKGVRSACGIRRSCWNRKASCRRGGVPQIQWGCKGGTSARIRFRIRGGE